MLLERFVDTATYDEAVAELLAARTADEIMIALGERFNIWPRVIEQCVLTTAIEERGLIAPAHIGS